ncbi:hypothetical protein DEI97_014490 [Curtobacterium sp. MCLR17_032]|uniref:hypothetical protein n=1 Tax=Curtobacterium sp. MCLR17_032 TaxID=2175650 RepID=UPI000DA8F148|nr:hypothetical protein [Curtobacterium sp. MCLR17_032]WIE60946.1 hypothetical protein DEI97_014490 [Curtobacterium sp. MCLR17_032]
MSKTDRNPPQPRRTLLLDEMIDYLAHQRAESRRRNEEHRYAEFHLVTGVQTSMARSIWFPNLGAVPSDTVLTALRAVPADL